MNSGYCSLDYYELESDRMDYKFKRFHHDNPNYYNNGNLSIGDCIEEYKAPMKFDPNKQYNYYGSSTDAIDEKGHFVNSVKIDGKNPPSRAKQLLTENTIVMTNLEGNRGMPAIVTSKVAGNVLSSAFIVVKPKENIDINYLKLVLHSQYIQDYLRHYCSTGLNPAQACWSLDELLFHLVLNN